jgi:hypothetical protein
VTVAIKSLAARCLALGTEAVRPEAWMQRYGRRCWLRQRWRPAISSAAKSPSPHLIGGRKMVALPIHSARRPSLIGCSGILASLRRPAALIDTYIC